MITKEEYISVIGQLIAQPAEAWKNDPFEELLKQCPKNILEKYMEGMQEEVVPSTSEDVRTVNFDARVHFSKILGGIYLDLSSLLKSQRSSAPDEYHLVSLQDAALIRKSFEFFLLTGILPFLEPGVGLGAAARSTFIKSWKVYDGDKEACREKLLFAGKVIVALLECNDALTVQFLPKFVEDVLCVRFQLLELKCEDFEHQFEEILSKCLMDIYFGALMFLTQDKKPNMTPKWMKVACGKQMTKILVAKDGLGHLLQYYKERAGDTWTDNLPLTKQVAWHLATVPKMFKHPRQYHEIIADQFFERFWAQKTIEKNLLNVFNCYVEELRVRFSLNCDLTIFDRLLRFWEILNKKIKEQKTLHMTKVEDFAPRHLRNLQLLAQVLPSADAKRIRSIFTCLFACIEFPNVKDILKASLETVGNLGNNLYMHIMTPSQSVQLVKKRKEGAMLIQEIDGSAEEDEEPSDELWLQGLGNPDEGVAARTECIFLIIDKVLSQTQNRTILEMISVGLDDFLKISEKERDDDAARFVTLDSARQCSSIHAHLVVGACFERLVSICADSGFSPEECVHVLQISNSILNNATIKFNRFAQRKRNMDVFRLTEEESREFEANRNTAKLCLPMMTTVIFITQSSQRLHEACIKSLEAMANFTKAADAFPSDDQSFNMAVEEVKNMLREYKVDVSQCNPAQQPIRSSERRRYSHVDICAEWMDELHDDEPATRGGTLMQIAKCFRSRNYMCNRLIEYGAFDLVKELVVDDDSYVYLSAINCLCEMALCDNRLFGQVLEYYEELSNLPEKSDLIAARLGRIGEAIGKLFIAKGDIMVGQFDRLATVFVKGMQDHHEIVRASSCGAFGNLMLATNGRGVEKWAGQLMHMITNLLKVDRSQLVRRSAIDLIRQCLKACGPDVLGMLREHLLDLHREVNRLMKTDRDETVRLHAQLCCEELDAALRHNQEATERSYHRKIRF